MPVQSVGSDLDELWGLAASLGMPLIMAQIGGTTPFDNFTTFSNQTAELTERAARAAPAVKFVVLGEGGGGLPENVSHVVGSGDGATGGRFWGRFGIASPAGDATDDGNAARYFNLPE